MILKTKTRKCIKIQLNSKTLKPCIQTNVRKQKHHKEDQWNRIVDKRHYLRIIN